MQHHQNLQLDEARRDGEIGWMSPKRSAIYIYVKQRNSPGSFYSLAEPKLGADMATYTSGAPSLDGRMFGRSH